MLPKVNLLRKEKDFEAVFKNNRSYYGSCIGIKVKRVTDETSRFGFLVGGKISKKAVERNLIKRRIKAVVKDNLANIKEGFDIVILTMPPILTKEYGDIKSEVEEGLKKLQII
jgi:ribonuclease P protein component